jgi:GxxExxY protein
MCVELAHMGIPFERERRFALEYRGVRVADYVPDLLVADTVVVEIKSVRRLEPVFTAQVITYLRTTKLRVGLILNFNAPETDRRPETRSSVEHRRDRT